MSDEIDEKINQLRSEFEKVDRELDGILYEIAAIDKAPTGIDSSVYNDITERMAATARLHNQISHDIQELERRRGPAYIRPTGGIYSLVNRLHPVTPELESRAAQPYTAELKKIRSMKTLAAVTLVVSVLTGCVVAMLAPWTAIPLPTLLHASILSSTGSSVLATTCVILVVAAYMFFVSRKARLNTSWDKGRSGILGLSVVEKEHHYRLGAETWSIGYQVWVSLVFGVCYLGPFASVSIMAGIAVLGFVLTRVYIKAHAKSGGSTRQAVLTSTKLHAAVFGWMMVALLGTAAVYAFQVFVLG